MGWEQRGNNSYYYRKARRGKHVHSEYVGRGIIGRLGLMIDQADRDRRKARRIEHSVRIDMEAAVDHLLAQDAQAIALIIEAALHISGFHKHKGQWRKMRHETQAVTSKASKE